MKKTRKFLEIGGNVRWIFIVKIRSNESLTKKKVIRNFLGWNMNILSKVSWMETTIFFRRLFVFVQLQTLLKICLAA